MMAGLRVDAGLCIGCGRCVRACGSGGIEVEGRLARPTEGCVLCGSCVDACPAGAISIERGDAAGTADLSSYRGIFVFAQVDGDGRLAAVALELTGRARELADARGCGVTALLAEGAGAGADNAGRLIAAGADEVVRCDDARMALPDAEVTARWVESVARERRPEAILIGATAFGRQLAPMVSVRLETGLTADCTALDIDPGTGLLRQTRPAFGGNLMATIVCPAHRPQMATVRPGIFREPDPDPARTGRVTDVPLDASIVPRVRVLSVDASGPGASIADAERLVVVGRGIGSKKNVPLMRRLARALGAELGCTRPLVEAGWLEYPHQVGQTGVSVSPRVLVSIGVSGAIQHLAGIGGAETVIAVNEDPSAPIFGVADYKVVADAIDFATELERALGERRG